LLLAGSNRAAYVYKQVNGAWREQQKLMLGTDGVVDLKHEAGVLAIGARGDAPLFGRNSSGHWVQRQRLVLANPDRGFGDGDFGATAAIDRGMILVSAPNTGGPDEGSIGSVYGFVAGASQSARPVTETSSSLAAVSGKPIFALNRFEQ
jgi:hypothetical protein